MSEVHIRAQAKQIMGVWLVHAPPLPLMTPDAAREAARSLVAAAEAADEADEVAARITEEEKRR